MHITVGAKWILSEDEGEVGTGGGNEDNSAYNVTKGQLIINNVPSINNEGSLMSS